MLLLVHRGFMYFTVFCYKLGTDTRTELTATSNNNNNNVDKLTLVVE